MVQKGVPLLIQMLEAADPAQAEAAARFHTPPPLSPRLTFPFLGWPQIITVPAMHSVQADLGQTLVRKPIAVLHADTQVACASSAVMTVSSEGK